MVGVSSRICGDWFRFFIDCRIYWIVSVRVRLDVNWFLEVRGIIRIKSLLSIRLYIYWFFVVEDLIFDLFLFGLLFWYGVIIGIYRELSMKWRDKLCSIVVI